MLQTINHKVNIEIDFGQLSNIIDWCEKHCIGNWAFTPKAYGGEEAGNYDFFFEDNKDYINFLLWKK